MERDSTDEKSHKLKVLKSELEILEKSEKKFKKKVEIATEMKITHPNLRIIQRNVIYILGIKPKIAKKDILLSKKFFGQYGKISKIFLSKKPFYLKNSGDYCYSAYITFEKKNSANFAIAGLNNFTFEGKKMEASYSTNRYCRSFLRNKDCKNKNCNYIHYKVDEGECFIKGRGIENRDIFQSQKIYAYQRIVELNEDELKQFDKDQIDAKLPTIGVIIKNAKEFIEKKNLYTPRLFDEMGDIYSAHHKIQRLSDSEMIFTNIDLSFMDSDHFWRENGYFYKPNIQSQIR